MSKDGKYDLYYLGIAKIVAQRSKCLSRKIGSILVKDDSIIGAGVNGPARGVKHCNERNLHFYSKLDDISKGGDGTGSTGTWYQDGDKSYPNQCPRRVYGYESGQGLHLCSSGHSERNCLIQAARNGISTKDTTLYAYCPLPCMPCMIEIINAGVKRLVYLKGKDYDEYSRTLLEESKIQYTEYKKENIDGKE